MGMRAMFKSVLLSVALAHTLVAQVPGIGSSRSESQQAQVEDPLGRSTPRGTITAFTEAVHRGDFVAAARTMQLPPSQRVSTEELASGLSELMDRYFDQGVTTINGTPDGALDDGLPIDRERIGLVIHDRRVSVELVRVTDSLTGPIWLISQETLARVPALRRSITAAWYERGMPTAFVRRSVLGISLAQWVLLVGSFVLPLIVLRLLANMVIALVRRVVEDPARERRFETWYRAVRSPTILVLTLAIHLSSVLSIGLPLTFRIRYGRVGLVVAVLAVAWLARRVLTISFERTRNMIWGRDSTSARSLLLLGERLVKLLVTVVAILAILSIVGVNTKTALAGLGIGGVALAFGAQKTIENFLGGVFLLSDRALAVGDMCSVNNRVGWVEDITLRSVRLRTLDQTLVSIPAGVLAQAGIENFATRGKILMQTTLRLRYGTNAEQLRRILDGVRARLAAHPKLERDVSRIRLTNFGEQAVELEIFAYVTTSDYAEFLAVREDLLLEIAGIVEAAGSGFAQPTQFVYMDNEAAQGPIRPAVAPDDVRLASIADTPANAKVR